MELREYEIPYKDDIERYGSLSVNEKISFLDKVTEDAILEADKILSSIPYSKWVYNRYLALTSWTRRAIQMGY